MLRHFFVLSVFVINAVFSNTAYSQVSENVQYALLRLLQDNHTIKTEEQAEAIIHNAVKDNDVTAIQIAEILNTRTVESLTQIAGEGKYLELSRMASNQHAKAMLILGQLYAIAEDLNLYEKGKSKSYLEQASKSGLGKAKTELYYRLIKEKGSKERAFNLLYEAASVIRHRDAMYTLALHYRDIDNDMEKAFKWLIEAADREHPEAIRIVKGFKKNAREARLEVLKKEVEKGSIKAKKELDWMNGKYEEPDTEEYQLLKQIATDGSPIAQLEFADHIQTHIGNEVAERHWVEQAARQDYPDALFRLARIYEDQDYDYIAANKLYRKAANLGHPRSMNALGINYIKGLGLEVNVPEGLKLYHMAAEKGEKRAQFSLGYRYLHGQDVPQDIDKGIQFYELAAKQGHVAALSNLGLTYWNGKKGVEKDRERAFELFKEAANQGNHMAQKYLGKIYRAGEIVPKDEVASFKWYLKSSLRGNAPASYYVGSAYQFGEGVEKDYKKALLFYNKAANGGDIFSLCHIGTFYEAGKVVEKNIAEAKELYLRGAQAQEAYCQYLLGKRLYREKKIPEAKKWLEIAANKKYKRAEQLLSKIK